MSLMPVDLKQTGQSSQPFRYGGLISDSVFCALVAHIWPASQVSDLPTLTAGLRRNTIPVSAGACLKSEQVYFPAFLILIRFCVCSWEGG